MSKDSKNEMEQIQKALEAFLEQEVEGYHKDQQEKSPHDDLDILIPYETIKTNKKATEKGINTDLYPGKPRNSSGQQRQSAERADSGRQRQSTERTDSGRQRQSTERTDSRQQRQSAERTNSRNQSQNADRTGSNRKSAKREEEYHSKSEKKKKRIEKSNEDWQREDVGRRKEREKGGKELTGRKKKKKKSRLKKLLVSILLVCFIVAGLWYYIVGMVYDKMSYQKIEALASEPMKEEGVINILLIGNDSRSAGDDGRSDAMILLSISSKTKTIHMTSLLRDMYVEIPGYQGNRLNAAYSYGGAELLLKTVEKNLDISVDRYLLVNFQAFANLVDAVGGVDLELTSEEVRYVNGYLVEYNILEGRAEGTDYMDESVSGMVHLNGPQSLAYSRNRFLGTDFGRTERQRKVLSSVFKKLPVAMLTNPSGLIEGLFPNLTTNLTKWECYQLSLTVVNFITYDMVQGSIPLEGTFKNSSIRGMSVLEVDFEANKQYIRTNIYGK